MRDQQQLSSAVVIRIYRHLLAGEESVPFSLQPFLALISRPSNNCHVIWHRHMTLGWSLACLIL